MSVMIMMICSIKESEISTSQYAKAVVKTCTVAHQMQPNNALQCQWTDRRELPVN